MRHVLMTCVGVLSISCGVALASNNPGSPQNQVNPGAGTGPVYVIPDCATGFDKTNVMGSPQGQSYSYTCKTPTVGCPPAPKGMTGGFGDPQAKAVSKGGQFSYTCSYSPPIPPPK